MEEELRLLNEFFEKLGNEIPEETFDNLTRFLSFVAGHDNAEKYYTKVVFFFKRKTAQEKRPGWETYWHRLYLIFKEDLVVIRRYKGKATYYHQVVDQGEASYESSENLNVNFTLTQDSSLEMLVNHIKHDLPNLSQKLTQLVTIYYDYIEAELDPNDSIPDIVRDEEDIFPEKKFDFLPN
jgi:hypothetical protein